MSFVCKITEAALVYFCDQFFAAGYHKQRLRYYFQSNDGVLSTSVVSSFFLQTKKKADKINVPVACTLENPSYTQRKGYVTKTCVTHNIMVYGFPKMMQIHDGID